MPRIPKGYKRMEGSERRPSPKAEYLGAADAKETLTITMILRRRPDGPAPPDFNDIATTPASKRRRLTADEFAAKYGAAPDEIARVVGFAQSHGLTVVETHAARRSVVVSGTVAQMNKAFAVTLGRYEQAVVHRRGERPQTETYRGWDGFIYVPEKLAGIIVGVFGLDNRSIDKHNGAGDPQKTNPLTVPQVARLYRFPTNSAKGHSIGIVAVERGDGTCGYDPNDINQYYGSLNGATGLNLVPPTMPLPFVSIDGTQNKPGNPDIEATMDICIASTVAQGATIVVYFKQRREKAWIDLMGRLAFPDPGDPAPPSVLSCSFYISDGDDAETIANEGITVNFVNQLHEAFWDAARQGITVCISSGDTGSDSKVGSDPTVSVSSYTFPADYKAHVQYPGSDPWVLSCGGTTIGNVSGASFDEYVWNDDSGATGGGVSAFFPKPSYQKNAGIPVSVNDRRSGRGVPDIGANASANSGYWIPVGGNPLLLGGTSAAAPLYAGLIAVINAALRHDVGFLNPILYKLYRTVCRDVNPFATIPRSGPTTNSLHGIAGYPAKRGWDACTGWGSIDGKKFLAALRPKRKKKKPQVRHK
jgi:kumamolisin